MRDVSFDMIGMTLMAMAVILICGVGLVWGYFAGKRSTGSAPSPVLHDANGRELGRHELVRQSAS